MSIVDFHTHFFSRVFFETLAAQSPLSGDVDAKLAALAAKTGIELPDRDLARHLARWIGELDRHGVEHFASFASVPEEIPDVGKAARMSNGRMSAFALVNPTVEGCAGRVEKLLAEQGFAGVLLFPAMHHYTIDDARAKPLLEVLDARRATVFVHCGMLIVKLRDHLQLPRPQNLAFANPLALVPAANAHPRVNFVVPHFGAGFLRETLIAGAQCANVFVDTSSTNSWRATQWPKPALRDVFERALEVFGPERVLFGTDSNTFPAGWRKERHDEQRAIVESLGLGAADVAAIFAGNARRLTSQRSG
jgi:predicted TIM-barrel fold metal-dependent hydrolase